MLTLGALAFAQPWLLTALLTLPPLYLLLRLTPPAPRRVPFPPLAILRRSEDAYVDALFADAPRCGAPLICATFPRVFGDPNRGPDELDPDMFSAPPPGGSIATRTSEIR